MNEPALTHVPAGLAVQPAAPRAADPPDTDNPEITTNTMMAGFIVWLAAQRMPNPQRQHVHREVRRFLSWRDSELARRQSPIRPNVWCYLRHRHLEGLSDCAVLSAWRALVLFLDYTEQPPQPWAATEVPLAVIES